MTRDMVDGGWGVDLLAVTASISTFVGGEYLAALVDRAPPPVHLKRTSAILEDIAVTEPTAGVVLLVRPAEMVPVDGRLLSSSSSFDESAITGESLPVDPEAGDGILSGSVNGPVAVRMTAIALVRDSQFSRIVALLPCASYCRPPVVPLSDGDAVPFTLLSPAIEGLAWWLAKMSSFRRGAGGGHGCL